MVSHQALAELVDHSFDRPMPYHLDQSLFDAFFEAADANPLTFRQNGFGTFIEPEIDDPFPAPDTLGKELHPQKRLSTSRGTEDHRD